MESWPNVQRSRSDAKKPLPQLTAERRSSIWHFLSARGAPAPTALLPPANLRPKDRRSGARSGPPFPLRCEDGRRSQHVHEPVSGRTMESYVTRSQRPSPRVSAASYFRGSPSDAESPDALTSSAVSAWYPRRLAAAINRLATSAWRSGSSGSSGSSTGPQREAIDYAPQFNPCQSGQWRIRRIAH